MPTPVFPPGFDFTDPDLNRERLPVEELAALRRSAPIWWNEQTSGGAGPFGDGGFWSSPNTAMSKRSRSAVTSSPAS